MKIKKIKVCKECGKEHTDPYKDYCYNDYQKLLMRRLREKLMSCVYCITNKTNGRMYIGSTADDPTYRFNVHVAMSRSVTSNNYNSPLSQDIREYGIDNFSFEVLWMCKPEARKQIEQKAIEDAWRDGKALYNKRAAYKALV